MHISRYFALGAVALGGFGLCALRAGDRRAGRTLIVLGTVSLAVAFMLAALG